MGMTKEGVKTTKETDGLDKSKPYILVMTGETPVLRVRQGSDESDPYISL